MYGLLIFRAMLWFGVPLTLAGLLWKAALRKPVGGMAVLTALYGLGVASWLFPSGWWDISRLLPGVTGVEALLCFLNGISWRVGDHTVSADAALAMCWAAVFCILLGRYIFHWIQAAQTIQQTAVPVDEHTQRLLSEIAQETAKLLPVSVCILPGLQTPCGFGLLHRWILLPDFNYTDTELLCILRHEYTHFRCHDILLKQLILLLAMVYWWNPAVCLLRREMEQAIELRCDAAVTHNMSKTERASYLRAIVHTLKASEDDVPSGWEGAGVRGRFAAVAATGGGHALRSGNPGAWAGCRRGILIFLLIFAISFQLSIGSCVWNSVNAAAEDIRQAYGTGFCVRLPEYFPANALLYQEIIAPDSTVIQRYSGPRLDDSVIEEVLKVPGVTGYNAENEIQLYLDSARLTAGRYAQELAYYGDDVPNDPLGTRITRMLTRTTKVHGNAYSEQYEKFRTGEFTLANGRHLTPKDRYKVLISDTLAEKNGLRVGDALTVSYRRGLANQGQDALEICGEPKTLEILGIFHVNTHQPVNHFTAEDDFKSNWLLTDPGTVQYFEKIENQILSNGFVREPQYHNVTFFTDRSVPLERILQELKQLKTFSAESYFISADDLMYQSKLEPLLTIRNLIALLSAAVLAGCILMLCMVLTEWARQHRNEVRAYLSAGFRKTAVLGHFALEAAALALAAGLLSFSLRQEVSEAAGNRLLATVAENAQEYCVRLKGDLPDGSQKYSAHIDFTSQPSDFPVLLLVDLFLIGGAGCKGGLYLFSLRPQGRFAKPH